MSDDVVLEDRAEPVAGRAGAARVVEREELRRRHGAACRSFGHSNRSVNGERLSGGPATRTTHRRPPPRTRWRSASGSRASISAETVSRSTTTSSSRARVTSVFEPTSSSRWRTSPSTETRTNPCARRLSTTTSCVTLAESRSGKATEKRVPAGSARTASVTDWTVSGRISRPQTGQKVWPTRAQRRRR